MKLVLSDIQVDKDLVNQKIENLLDDDTMTKIQQLFAETIDPWTPFLSGELHSNIEVDATGVTYLVDYAKNKYYGNVYHKEVHPLATSHWDEVAMETEMETVEAKVKEILIERAKQLYG